MGVPFTQIPASKSGSMPMILWNENDMSLQPTMSSDTILRRFLVVHFRPVPGRSDNAMTVGMFRMHEQDEGMQNETKKSTGSFLSHRQSGLLSVEANDMNTHVGDAALWWYVGSEG